MTGSKEMFMEEREMQGSDPFEEQASYTRPQEVMIQPDNILVISKQNAKTFHDQVKQRIKDTGYGLFEYVELIKFFEKLKEIISGNSQGKTPEEREGDKELKSMIRDELAKYPTGKFTTNRGVRFELFEAGTKYDYSKCGDPILVDLVQQLEAVKEKVKEREEFLKNTPKEGIEIRHNDELIAVYPPTKSSTPSYKVTLAR